MRANLVIVLLTLNVVLISYYIGLSLVHHSELEELRSRQHHISGKITMMQEVCNDLEAMIQRVTAQ
jgi:hypothetical protein